MSQLTTTHDMEVNIKSEGNGKAVIEGHTAIPFQSFVTLVLQRKVFTLFKQWGREPVVVNGDLLTQLASAPQDNVENRAHLITVSLGMGLLAGICMYSLFLGLMAYLSVSFPMEAHFYIAGGIIALGLLAYGLTQMKRVRQGEKLVEAVEGLSSFLKS